MFRTFLLKFLILSFLIFPLWSKNATDKQISASPAFAYAHDKIRGLLTGYWGQVDALIDWCEPNYVVSYYIAEFVNTLSSVPMILWSIMGVVYCWKYAIQETRFLFVFIALGIVGIGSVAFHGTLRFHAQLLDELPMVLGSFIMLYCTLDIRQSKTEKSNMKLIISLIILALFDTFIYVFLQWWEIFLFSYGGVVALMVCYGATLLWHCKSSLIRKICFTAVLFYHGGFLLWLIENAMCPIVQRYNFHALWHIAAGYGTYLWIWALIGLRAEHLEYKEPRLRYGIACHYIQLKINK